MSLPAPCARITAGVRPPRRKPGGSATTADTPPPPGSAIRRRRLASFIGERGARPYSTRARGTSTCRPGWDSDGSDGGPDHRAHGRDRRGQEHGGRLLDRARGARDRRRPDRARGLPAGERGLRARRDPRGGRAAARRADVRRRAAAARRPGDRERRLARGPTGGGGGGMAHARLVTLVLALAAAGSARAAGPCEEGRGQTGLALAAAAGGLAVAAVDDDSAAMAGSLRVGDAVVQANGTLARSCGDYARVVREARRERKAVLLLVRRADTELPLALAASTWERAVAVVAAPAPAEAPSVRALVATPPPSPLPPETHVSVDEVTRGLSTLARDGRPRASLTAYQKDVLHLRRQVETLAARAAAPAAVLSGLRTVLEYYEGAAVAWASEETQRERERRPRHLPAGETATATFFEDSEATALLDEFPFLRATVVRDPAPGLVGESAGLWRPREARALLWGHGREELGRLTGWLAAGTP